MSQNYSLIVVLLMLLVGSPAYSQTTSQTNPESKSAFIDKIAQLLPVVGNFIQLFRDDKGKLKDKDVQAAIEAKLKEYQQKLVSDLKPLQDQIAGLDIWSKTQQDTAFMYAYVARLVALSNIAAATANSAWDDEFARRVYGDAQAYKEQIKSYYDKVRGNSAGASVYGRNLNDEIRNTLEQKVNNLGVKLPDPSAIKPSSMQAALASTGPLLDQIVESSAVFSGSKFATVAAYVVEDFRGFNSRLAGIPGKAELHRPFNPPTLQTASLFLVAQGEAPPSERQTQPESDLDRSLRIIAENERRFLQSFERPSPSATAIEVSEVVVTPAGVWQIYSLLGAVAATGVGLYLRERYNRRGLEAEIRMLRHGSAGM